jgi:hypothetical protein
MLTGSPRHSPRCSLAEDDSRYWPGWAVKVTLREPVSPCEPRPRHPGIANLRIVINERHPWNACLRVLDFISRRPRDRVPGAL